MNTLSRLRGFCCLLLILSLAGCMTPQAPEGKAFVTLDAIWQAEKTAFLAYGRACARGQVAPETQTRVDAAHEHFRKAVLAAIKLSHGNGQARAPDEVVRLANELILLMQEVTP